MPNPNTIPYFRYQDIQIPDAEIRAQFDYYMTNGQYTQALEILETNEQKLQGKAYIAQAVNIIINGILDLENRYHEGVTLFLSKLAEQYNLMINNLKLRQTWNNTIQYTPYNFVIYNQDIYMCITEPPIGTVPTDQNYWFLVGLKGEKGAPGVDVLMKYAWNSKQTYNINDLVTYKNNIYVALNGNSGAQPDTSNSWMLFVSYDKGKITVSMNPPANPSDNAVWFHVDSDPNLASPATPVVGQFKRYIKAQNIWDEMYPSTVFTWVAGVDDYIPPVFYTQITIVPTDWVNKNWTYVYPNLREQNIVDVFPVQGMTAEQIILYNSLSINVVGTNITLSTSSATAPTVELPIRIQIL